MSSKIYDQLQDDVKTAMKSREAAKVTALRTLVAGIKDATVNAGKEISDDDVITVIGKAIKQRMDSVEQFLKGDRKDLADKEQAEIDWFKKYQPAQLSEAEIEDLAKKAIEESGASGKGDVGTVMKVLMPQVRGRADGKSVNQAVLRLLSESAAEDEA